MPQPNVEHVTSIRACERIVELHPGFPVGAYVESDRMLYRVSPSVWKEAALAGLVRIENGLAYPNNKKEDK